MAPRRKMSPSETFAARLRETREARGKSQAKLAEQVGMSRAALLRVERNERGLLLDEAIALSASLSVSLAHLLTPPGDAELDVGLRGYPGLGGGAVRSLIRYGNPLAAAGSRPTDALASEVVPLAQALLDAQRGDDKAGMREAMAALGAAALRFGDGIEGGADA